MTALNIEDVTQQILFVLGQVRPFLMLDGGDIEFVSFTEDGIVKVRFLGSCKDCALKPMTLRAGIERAIMHGVPEVKRIEAV